MQYLRCWTASVLVVFASCCSVANAEIKWWFDFAGSDPVVPTAKLNAITASMDVAVAYYNAYSNYSLSHYATDARGLRVIYQSAVPTANANYRGRISFGGSTGQSTALHEMSHILGVGTFEPTWTNLISGGKWQGSIANSQLAEFDGPGATVNADGSHFWPYGLNFSSEDGFEARRRHVQMVGVLRQDMGLADRTYDLDGSDFNADGVLNSQDLQVLLDNYYEEHTPFHSNQYGYGAFSKGDRDRNGLTDSLDWHQSAQDFASVGAAAVFQEFATSLGDFSSDHQVTPADLLVWAASAGVNDGADADDDGDSDGTDFLTWQRHLGIGAPEVPVLLVDVVTGDATIQNLSRTDYVIDAYAISSGSGSLLTSWNSLDDQGLPSWEEALPSSHRLSELNPTADLELRSGTSVPLAGLFNSSGGSQDLAFEFRDVSLGTLGGAVQYVNFTAPLGATQIPEPTALTLSLIGVLCVSCRQRLAPRRS